MHLNFKNQHSFQLLHKIKLLKTIALKILMFKYLYVYLLMYMVIFLQYTQQKPSKEALLFLHFLCVFRAYTQLSSLE